MADKYIHIVCLDTPAPPDYGGAIDMYFKITSLQAIGKKIILHYFDYKPDRTVKELRPFCDQVYSYKRKSFFQSLPFTKPFIVSSRINRNLINRLNQDEHPVILEGIHCTGILPHLNSSKKIIIRVHNNEAVYYEKLAKAENNFFKRLYFKRESKLLRLYQNKMRKHYPLACLSLTDAAIFKEKYGFADVHFIPCFIPWQTLNIKPGKGEFFLYHGNLSVKENEVAATWLIENIFNQLNLPFIVAGKGISKRLAALVRNPNIKLINEPSIEDLDILIRNAHVNVLPSMNTTGVKLKLLHALIEGRFCFTNHQGVAGSGLENMVETIESNAGWIAAINGSMNLEVTEALIQEREKILDLYNNRKNAEKLTALL